MTQKNYDGSEAMTVGELKQHLARWPDHYQVTFSGGLTFSRLKSRDENHVDIELSPMAYIVNRETGEMGIDDIN